MVATCPLCLPVGAISYLIENGRQLDIFEDLTGVDECVSVDRLISVSGTESDDGGLYPWVEKE